MEYSSKISNENFRKICRICLKEHDNLKSIFSNNYISCIKEIASIQITTGDGLPPNLCIPCTTSLENTHDFIKLIKRSDSLIKEYVFKNKNKIDLLEGNKHPYKDVENKNTPFLPLAPKADNNNATCEVCKKNFTCKGQLTRHLKTHVGIKSHICEKCGNAYMESGSLKKHILAKHTNREKPYKCNECNLSFNLKSTLTRHIRTHTGEKPFGCNICHKFYPSKSYLNKHKKAHNSTQEKLFICEICSKSFVFKDGLKAHLKIHSDNRPFNCLICKKSFATNGSLKSHLKYIHTKEKNFMCQVCAKTFVTKHELNEHMRRHTGEKKIPSHQCNMCEKKLSSSTHLKLHIRSEHTGERPYQCDFCTKSFITSQTLKIHRRYHTGERPYSCTYCGKGFVTNECVKNHERIHTGERPYFCWICGVSFTQSSTLKTHMKNH